jgi:hypothetical protein
MSAGPDRVAQYAARARMIWRRGKTGADDGRVVGVESLGPQHLTFFFVHTGLGRFACRYGSPHQQRELVGQHSGHWRQDTALKDIHRI